MEINVTVDKRTFKNNVLQAIKKIMRGSV